VAPYYFGAQVRLAEIANVAFNAYLGLVLAYALVRVPSKNTEPLVSNLRPFLVLSVVSYAGLVVYALLSIVSPHVTLTPRIPVALNGALCFLWSLSSIVLFLPYLNTKDPGQAELPAGFAQRYRLTPREREVAELVLTGMRARDIAERLFVSTKTVEAHLYSVYRKCGVRSRVELLNRVRSWTRGGL
jgi:DNA-binding CsgD family transcriptional regulator